MEEVQVQPLQAQEDEPPKVIPEVKEDGEEEPPPLSRVAKPAFSPKEKLEEIKNLPNPLLSAKWRGVATLPLVSC